MPYQAHEDYQHIQADLEKLVCVGVMLLISFNAAIKFASAIDPVACRLALFVGDTPAVASRPQCTEP